MGVVPEVRFDDGSTDSLRAKRGRIKARASGARTGCSAERGWESGCGDCGWVRELIIFSSGRELRLGP